MIRRKAHAVAALRSLAAEIASLVREDGPMPIWYLAGLTERPEADVRRAVAMLVKRRIVVVAEDWVDLRRRGAWRANRRRLGAGTTTGDMHMEDTDTHEDTPVPPIRTVTWPYAPPPRDEVLKGRLLDALARDQPRPNWGPGKWAYSELRRQLGGRVDAAWFRRLIDELLAAGLIVEIREPASGRGWRQPRHILILVDRVRESRWTELIKVRGREDVLRRLRLAERAA